MLALIHDWNWLRPQPSTAWSPTLRFPASVFHVPPILIGFCACARTVHGRLSGLQVGGGSEGRPSTPWSNASGEYDE